MIKIWDKVTNILAAVVGTLQQVIPLIKEIVVDVVRLIDLVAFWIPQFDGDKIILKIDSINDIIMKYVSMLKDWLIRIGKDG